MGGWLTPLANLTVSTFNPPRDYPVDTLSAITRSDNITRPLNDTARYRFEGLSNQFSLSGLQIQYVSPVDAHQRTSFALIPNECDWRLFLTQLKISGVPLDPCRPYSPTSLVSIRIWALPLGRTPQDVLTPNLLVPPGAEVIDLLTDDELNSSTPDQPTEDILSGSRFDSVESNAVNSDPVEPEDEAFEPGPIDPSIVEAVLYDMCNFFGIDHSDAVRPGFTHTPPRMKMGLRLHQLWSFFWVFESKTARNIATALLADEMGLGKTATSLAVAVVSHRLRTLADHVSQHPNQHLAPNDKRTKCPSGTYTHGFQCPLLILRSWADEFARFVNASPDDGMILLTLPTTSALKSIDSTFSITANRCKPPTVVQFAVQPARIIVDEAHRIKGEATMLWDRIRRWQWRARSPTYLLALIGTPMTRDPTDFQRLLEHLNHPGASWSSPLQPPATSTLQALKRLASDYNKTIARSLNATAGSELDQQQQQVFLSNLSALVLAFTLCRRRDDMFAGQPLSAVPMVPFNVVECPPPDQFATDIENIFSYAKDEVQVLLDERRARWQELPEHRRRAEPTLELLVRQISSGVPNTSLTGEDFQGVFIKGTVEKAQAKSKIKQLGKQIRKMLADRKPPAHGADDVMPDKKMLVYSDSPFIAHLAFLWIANTFDIPAQIIDRGMSAASRLAAIEPFVTVPLDRLRRELDRPMEPPSPRVLVTTTGIIAEGLNSARANYLVLLGPLGTGGFSTPHLTLFLDPDNKAEMVVRQRQLNRAAIETEVWGRYTHKLEQMAQRSSTLGV
ncbi:hypothetical protein QBC34DRAFT_428287 [Podospora aff. communis PSN243]|uniref:SNF2 N-terminal domain-containing protein n=1 Tax=Podospora aff. communis PSN243 TaxID=3040156 RepID=A0AAV9GDP9_9PEZI|nr:hypothetical protein QBC34DRAFT_428287 [Podospora aff. communis PSN243]